MSTDTRYPLHAAVKSCDADLVRELASQHGLDDLDDAGLTPLQVAGRNGFAGMVPVLLGLGGTLDVADKHGRQASHLAAELGHQECVVALLDAGCDMEARTQQGHTPMMVAAASGHAHVVRELLTRLADVSATNAVGRSALFLAAQAGALECVDVLLDYAADPEQGDGKGSTPLTVAADDAVKSRVRPESVRLRRAAATPQRLWRSLSAVGRIVAAPPFLCPEAAQRSAFAARARDAAARAIVAAETAHRREACDAEIVADLRQTAVEQCLRAADLSDPADAAAGEGVGPCALDDILRRDAEVRRLLAIPPAGDMLTVQLAERVADALAEPTCEVLVGVARLSDALTAFRRVVDLAAERKSAARDESETTAAGLRRWAEEHRLFAGSSGRRRAEESVVELRAAAEECREAELTIDEAEGTLRVAVARNARYRTDAAQQAEDSAACDVATAKEAEIAASRRLAAAWDAIDAARRAFPAHAEIQTAITEVEKSHSAAFGLLATATAPKGGPSFESVRRAIRPCTAVLAEYRTTGLSVGGRTHIVPAVRLSDDREVVLRCYSLSKPAARDAALAAVGRALRARRRMVPTLPPAEGAAPESAEEESLVLHPDSCFAAESPMPGGGPMLFLEMRFARGGCLADRLAGPPPEDFGPEAAAQLASRLALAVVALHRAGIAHGDITEGNVVFWGPLGTPEAWRPCMTDFLETAAVDNTRTVSVATHAALPPESRHSENDEKEIFTTRQGDLWQLGRLVRRIGLWCKMPTTTGAGRHAAGLIAGVATKLMSEDPTDRPAAGAAASELASAAGVASAILAAVGRPPYWAAPGGPRDYTSSFARDIGRRAGLPVKRALRVQNESLFIGFSGERRRVGEALESRTAVPLPESLDPATGDAGGAFGLAALMMPECERLRLAAAGDLRLRDLPLVNADTAQLARAHPDMFPVPAANEALLFHGVRDPAVAELIAAGGFDPSRSGDSRGALFGAATCFTPDPATALRYARQGGVVIVARVILGAVADVGEGNATTRLLRRPPTLDGQEHDSVLGHNGQHGGIVCVYRHSRAYPEFLLFLG